MTPPQPAAGQLDLFGNADAPAPPVASTGTAAGETNDIDLIRHIAGNAGRNLYLLVGRAERVYARADGAESTDVVRVPRYEEDAVHQLLRRRLLTRGGQHAVTCGAASLNGTAVLAPRSTRLMVERWEHLQRPASWIARNHGRRR
jgi:adenosylmethionine-8-amino-7-oxononanoate aminotransferase